MLGSDLNVWICRKGLCVTRAGILGRAMGGKNQFPELSRNQV
jgi:hypothetical protein